MSNDNTLLYNKYRPNKLSDVVGHSATVKDLQKRSKEGNLPRVIFLSGITGTGKTTLQRIIAKNILCLNKDKEGNSCNVCEICSSIIEEKITNYYFEINCSNVNIDESRQIAENASVKSFSNAKAKVFVLDEAQELKKSQAAMNNLLKPIEKDYKNVYFIFGAMDDKSVPKAIVGRCTTYKLKPHNMEDIATKLADICQKESVILDTEEKANVLLTISENSGGSLRQAISYLERVIYSELWTTKQAIEELGIVSSSELNLKINALFKGKPEAFDITYNEELLTSIRYMFSTMYKKLSGIEVEEWQVKKLMGIDKTITLEQVEYALGKIFELNKFPYVNQEMIDFILVDIFNYNKRYINQLVEMKIDSYRTQSTTLNKSTESKQAEPVRRRGQA